MFAKWKAERAAREAVAQKIEQDGYLRRLQNSARTLTGTTHSGPGCNDALDPYEIRVELRARLRELTKPKAKE